MNKIFTSLAIAITAITANAQVISQNATPNTVSTTGSVACGNSAGGYTSDNSYYRVFKLADYGINYDYKVTNVAIGVQTANADFPVEFSLSTYTGTFPNGSSSYLSGGMIEVGPSKMGGMADSGTSYTQVIPAGSTFVLEVLHDGQANTEQFYFGTNPGGQTGLSYLMSEGCGLTTPIATGTGALAGFATAKWVMTITGVNNLGVTEIINSKDLQILGNPVKDILRFKFGNNVAAEGVEIYDMAGKVVKSTSSKSNDINVSGFAKGAYILKVKANDGKVYIQKIIKD